MKRLHVSTKKTIFVALLAALTVFVLAGCTTVQIASSGSSSSSAGSSSESASESSSSAIETLSSSAASSSATSTSSASTGTGTSSGATTSGKYTTYVNQEEGYQFEIDSSFTAETNGSDVRVYTAKNGQVPYFSLLIMKNTTGQTPENLLNGMGQKVLEEHKNDLVVEPTANTVQLSNRKVIGFEYAYANSGKTYGVYTYAEEISGALFVWTGLAPADDIITPQALEHAMDTLQFLTA